MSPNRPALRYLGGKWRLAPWIVAHLPPHHCYVEPFGGAASVLLRKPPAGIEVYNDTYPRVVNFFQVLRAQTRELVDAIEGTPYDLDECVQATQPAADPLEDARRLYVLAGQARSGAGSVAPGGWRRAARSPGAIAAWRDTSHLLAIADRLQAVQIECCDALDVIRRYDSPATLFYLDPPYLPVTRGRRSQAATYAHEYTTADHRSLARVLAGIQGLAVLSGYPSALYDYHYPGWIRVDRRARTNGHRRATESLWISPRTWQALEAAL